jgi:hypothetical protein
LSKAYIHTYIPPVALSGFLQKNLQSALLVEKAPVKTKQPNSPPVQHQTGNKRKCQKSKKTQN